GLGHSRHWYGHDQPELSCDRRTGGLDDESTRAACERTFAMQITVYGATGTFGRRLVSQLHERGHTTIAAHRGSGGDTVTGEGVAEAAGGSDALVECGNRMPRSAGRATE